MSLSALSAAASTVLSTASLYLHGHRKGARPDTSGTSISSGSTTGITIGQLPVGAATPLFNKILQSLQQTAGAAAVSGATPAATTAGTAGSIAATGSPAAGANVQAFMHTLFQALKQDGLGAGAGGHIPVKPGDLSEDVGRSTWIDRGREPGHGEFECGLSELGERNRRGRRDAIGSCRRRGFRSGLQRRASELPQQPASESSKRRCPLAERYRQQRQRQRVTAGIAR